MAAFSYEYKVNGLAKAPAQAVGELFEQLQNSEAGLTPSSVLNASRDEGSLLHSSFEWDDAVAGEKYRLNQARSIIQNVVVVEKTTDADEREKVADRAFVITPGYKSAYVALDCALSNANWRCHLLKLAKEDMQIFAQKYRRLSELADVIQKMDEKIKTM